MAKKPKTDQEQADLDQGRQEAALNLPPESSSDNTDAQLAEDNIEIEKIRSILSANDVSGGFVRLERRGPLDTAFQYLVKIPVTKFDIDYIKDVYGGGDYRARTFRSNGCIWKPFEFSIDHRLRGKLDESQIKDLANDKEKNGVVKQALDLADRMRTPQTLDNTPVLLRVMDQQKQSSNDMLTLLMTMMTKSQENMAMMMSESQKTMATMMTAMIASSKVESAKPAFDFASTFTPILIEMVKSPQKTSMTDTLEVVRALKDVMSPEPKEDESMFDKVLKLLGPMGAQLLAGRGMQMPNVTPAGGQPIQVGNGAANGSQPSITVAPIHQTSAPAPEQDSLSAVRLFIEQLYRAAERRSDPGLYVDFILDALSDAQLLDLYRVLTEPDWHAKLFPDVNRFAQHQVWFGELRQQLVGAINQAQQAAMTAAQAAPVQATPNQPAAATATTVKPNGNN